MLELGAGTGYLGMHLARDLSPSRIVLTEMEQGNALGWLTRNVEANRRAGVPLPLPRRLLSSCCYHDLCSLGAAPAPRDGIREVDSGRG